MPLKPREKYNRILAVGRGTEGQLNNNCAENRSTPNFINGKIWDSVDLGHGTATIDNDCNLWTWGLAYCSGGVFYRSSPVQIPGKWLKASVSGYSGLGENYAAIKTNCTLWTWGNGLCGMIGNNSIASQSSPVQIPGTWSDVYVGNSSAAAIKANGDLFTWGQGCCGILGNNCNDNFSSPVFVGSGFKQVSIRSTGGIALKCNGEAFVWGGNTIDNTIKSSPVQVPGNWLKVVAGVNSYFALADDCSLWTWGINCNGALGISAPPSSSFYSMTMIPGKWLDVSVKTRTVLALKDNCTLWAWGENQYKSIRNSDDLNFSSPVQILGRYSKISAGTFGIAALEDCLYEKGKVYVENKIATTGRGIYGGIGNNSTDSQSKPITLSGRFEKISSGLRHSAAIKSDCTLWVWGSNNVGQLGLNDTFDRSSPIQIPGEFLSASAGYSANYAIKSDCTLWVTGFNCSGQLGTGNETCYSSYVQIPGTWKFICGNICVAVGIKGDDTLWTWGRSVTGQLGHNDDISKSSPTQIPGTWLKAAISCFGGAGIKSDCSLWVWGNCMIVWPATGCQAHQSSPLQIPGSWIDVNITFSGAQAIDTNCQLWQWGRFCLGSFGMGVDLANISTPVQIPGNWKKIQSYGWSVGAINENCELFVWGSNQYGQLGSGVIGNISSPTQISGKFLDLSIGNDQSIFICACTFEYNKEHNLKIASLNDLSLANKQGCWAEYVPEIDG